MPQMGPLPWVSLWLLTLSLILMFFFMVYFSFTPLNNSCKKNMNLNYYWKW